MRFEPEPVFEFVPFCSPDEKEFVFLLQEAILLRIHQRIHLRRIRHSLFITCHVFWWGRSDLFYAVFAFFVAILLIWNISFTIFVRKFQILRRISNYLWINWILGVLIQTRPINPSPLKLPNNFQPFHGLILSFMFILILILLVLTHRYHFLFKIVVGNLVLAAGLTSLKAHLLIIETCCFLITVVLWIPDRIFPLFLTKRAWNS